MSFETQGITGHGGAGPANNPSLLKGGGNKQASSSRKASRSAVNTQQQIQAEKRMREAEKAREASQREIREQIERAQKELGDIRLPFNHKLKYSVNFENHEVMVKVIDLTTDEVIKEFPAIAARNIQEFIGLLVDKEA